MPLHAKRTLGLVGLTMLAALCAYSTSWSAVHPPRDCGAAGKLAEAEARATSAEARAAAAEASLKQAEARRRSAEAAAAAAAARASPVSPVVAVGGGPSPYVHTLESIPAKEGDLMMMTYATGGVREMLHNWVLHVERLGLPVLVSAMDKDAVALATEKKFHCLDWSHTAAAEDTSYVRGSEAGFRALGVRKLDVLLPVLRMGINVVLSDVDCVWSSSPLPMFDGKVAGFEDFAAADLLVASDCMDPILDVSVRDPGCYHDSVDKNTGVLAVRATPNGIAAMAEWKVRLQVGEKNEQDQTTFNDLIDGNGRGHRWGMSNAQRSDFKMFGEAWCGSHKTKRGYNRLWAGGEDPETGGAGDASVVARGRTTEGSRRIFDVCLPNVSRHVHIGTFPVTAVAGGHTFFVQQLQSPTATWPMAVHATYQFGDTSDYAFGKRQRFRDWGMWLVDEEEEYITGSRYLVLEEDAPLAPREPWVGFKDLHARGRQHVSHLERVRQRLAHGFALARALNRTVVLPTLWCYCDKFWHRLDKCAIPSATESQPLPFVCPLDHVVDPSLLHGTIPSRMRRPQRGMQASRADGPWEDGLPFRGRHWLRQLGAHPRIGYSTATLSTAPPGEASVPMEVPPPMLSSTLSSAALPPERGGARHAFVPGSEGPRLVLPARRRAGELRAALKPYDHVRLLRVSLSDAGAMIGCYEDAQEAHDTAQLTSHIFPHSWCYRPFEMTPEWSAVAAKGAPKRGTEPWCVWGFAKPAVPGVCGAVQPVKPADGGG